MGHILNLACHAFHFTRDKDAVELAIKAAEELQQEEEWLGLHSEGEYD
jgi:CO dehydrogenase/acetyl-CoA synthase epsilon subunit